MTDASRRRLPRPPARGDIWLASFDPTVGREQAGVRPGLIVSSEGFNSVQSGLVVIVAISRTRRGYVGHVAIPADSTGLDHPSFAMTEQIRGFSAQRLREFLGRVDASTMVEVDKALGKLLGL